MSFYDIDCCSNSRIFSCGSSSYLSSCVGSVFRGNSRSFFCRSSGCRSFCGCKCSHGSSRSFSYPSCGSNHVGRTTCNCCHVTPSSSVCRSQGVSRGSWGRSGDRRANGGSHARSRRSVVSSRATQIVGAKSGGSQTLGRLFGRPCIRGHPLLVVPLRLAVVQLGYAWRLLALDHRWVRLPRAALARTGGASTHPLGGPA